MVGVSPHGLFMRSRSVSNLCIRRSPLGLEASDNSDHSRTQWGEKQRGLENQEVWVSQIWYILRVFGWCEPLCCQNLICKHIPAVGGSRVLQDPPNAPREDNILF